jgi:hypothetical protein
MSNEFQNDAIISFLLNKFPVDSSEKLSSSNHIEKYNDLKNIKKEDRGIVQNVIEFFKMYWFLLFVFFIILLFVLWKKYFKKN